MFANLKQASVKGTYQKVDKPSRNSNKLKFSMTSLIYSSSIGAVNPNFVQKFPEQRLERTKAQKTVNRKYDCFNFILFTMYLHLYSIRAC